MLRFNVWGMLAGVALSCFGARAHAACTMDNDCPGDLVCQDQVCVAAPAGAPAAAPAPAATPAAPSATAPAPAPVVASVPVVPPATAPEPAPELPRRSTPMVVGGAVMIPVGALLLAIAVLTSGPSDCKADEFGRVTPEEMDRCDNKPRTYAVAISGGLLVGGGIPLVVIGSQRVAKTSARAGVSPWLSREAAGLNLRLEL